MGLPVAVLVSRGAFGGALAQTLRRAGWTCVAREVFTGEVPADTAAVVVDPESLEEPVSTVCGAAQRTWPSLPVLVVGDARLDSAVEAMRCGATDYLDRAATAEEFAEALGRALVDRALRAYSARTVKEPERFPELWGASPAMERLRDRIDQARSSDATAVILGETGTGKELVARLLHASGPRSRGPFVIVSCSSIPPSLAESELFGHVKGAFSGAAFSHRGLIPAAHGGTLFLDDVGALTLDMQAKLLRVLQERSVRPVGANEEVPTDFRLLVSSSVPLDALVRERIFREDLYYRVAVLEITVPALRDRELDVLLLADRFLETAAARIGKKIVGITPAAAEMLLRHSWPGNVRELKNCIDYAVAVARFDHLGHEDLPESVRPERVKSAPLRETEARWEATERRHIEAVLRSVDGNRSQAAILLGIDRKTLHRKLDRFHIDIPPRSRSGVRARTEAASGEAPQSSRYRFNFR